MLSWSDSVAMSWSQMGVALRQDTLRQAARVELSRAEAVLAASLAREVPDPVSLARDAIPNPAEPAATAQADEYSDLEVDEIMRLASLPPEEGQAASEATGKASSSGTRLSAPDHSGLPVPFGLPVAKRPRLG